MDWEQWARYEIIWAGNQSTNKSSRRGHVPKVIVNHMTDGTAQSCIEHFTTPKNTTSSAHFMVSKLGQIYQFVKIEDNAWANGASPDLARHSMNPVIRSFGVNPNWVSVSIEHENFKSEKGILTSEQKEATINLHAYIMWYVEEKLGSKIEADKDHIIGHRDIDPLEKSFCPGTFFPFKSIINKLQGLANLVSYPDTKGHWAEELIELGTQQGWLSGYPNGVFRPDKQATRAEVVTMILKAIDATKKDPG